MALKVCLKPGEKIVIGGAVVVNATAPAEFLLQNRVPVLRERDILTPERAKSACERVYLATQMMYIDGENARQYHQIYWELVKEILSAAPSTREYIVAISNHILADQHYQALKVARRLIRYERELLNHATQ
jgi:flagellar biosynthesis repressor protein FlbT